MNALHAYHIIYTALQCGVEDFCLCPGARNAPLVSTLIKCAEHPKSKISCFYWFEERSAAFFALGKSRAAGKPVAVITTSGTAAGELLPAVMEAHYSATPLLVITADRPKRFRGSGAPQCAEQVGLFGCYVKFEEDLAAGESSQLLNWSCQGPAHLNACFDEPLNIAPHVPLLAPNKVIKEELANDLQKEVASFKRFVQQAHHLFVVVGALPAETKEEVVNFLLQLKAPIYVEGLSGLREDERLFPYRIWQPYPLFKEAEKAGYPIDSVLRIGGIPTFRPWRDLETLKQINVCSLSHLPFSGLSESLLIHAPLVEFLQHFRTITYTPKSSYNFWVSCEAKKRFLLIEKCQENPTAETSLIYYLSEIIPENSLVYLGNSLPIREWDLAATSQNKNFQMYASRGVNGIDGQLSTFLGLCQPGRQNVAILGDLTALYDMAGPWILRQLGDLSITIIVINNSGGQIFAPMFSEKAFRHEHQLSFRPLAEMWGLHYVCWNLIPEEWPAGRHSFIEVIPEPLATKQLNEAISQIASLEMNIATAVH